MTPSKDFHIKDGMAQNIPLEAIRSALSAFPDVSFAVLFGSAGKKRLTPTSDVDVGVAGAKPLSLDEQLALAARLAQCTAREVDVVDLAVASGPILQEALSGEVLKNETPALYAALMKRMWFEQEDMGPLTRMILKHRCQRFARQGIAHG